MPLGGISMPSVPAAGSVLVSIVPVALFLLLQRQFISGMTAGAINY